MGGRGLFHLLLVVTGVWAKHDDVDHLNLKSIFRIPRDFSTANFDHFELLERNNFHDQGNTASNVVNKKAKNAHRRTFQPSFANAQVMLRIGGDDLRDCSRVSLQQRQCSNENRGYPQQQLPMSYNPYIPAPLVYPCQQAPAYPYPGYYYPPPVQNCGQYPGVSNNYAQTGYGSRFPDTSVTYQEPENGNNFLDGISYKDHSEEDEAATEDQCEDHAVDPIDAPKECSSSENHSSEENPLMPQIHVENILRGNITTENECGNVNIAHRSDPLTPKVAYVEVNLAEAEKSCLKNCHNNTEESPQNDEACSPEQPAKEYLDSAKPEEQILVGGDIICGTCNRERDPSVPYGHRFSKDVDSLFNIAANNEEQKKTGATAVECGDYLHDWPYQQFAPLPEVDVEGSSYKFPEQSYGFQDNSMFQNSNPYFGSTSSIQTSYTSNVGSPQQSIMQHVSVGPAVKVYEGEAPIQHGTAKSSFTRTEQVVPHYSLPTSHHEVVYANDFQTAHTNTHDWPVSHSYQDESVHTSETVAEVPESTQNVEVTSYAVKEESSDGVYEHSKENLKSNSGADSQTNIPESIPVDEPDMKVISEPSGEPDASVVPASDQSERQKASAGNFDDLEIDVIPSSNPSDDLNVKFIPATNERGEPQVHVIAESKQRDEPKGHVTKSNHRYDEPEVEETSDSNEWKESNIEVVPERQTLHSPIKGILENQFFREKYTVESNPGWQTITEEVIQHNQDDSEESSSEEKEEYDRETAVYSSDNPKRHSDVSNDLVKLDEEEPQVFKGEYSSCSSGPIRSYIHKEPSSFGPFRIGSPSDSLDDYLKHDQPKRTFVETCQLPYRHPFLEQKVVSHDSYKTPSSTYYLKQQPTFSRYVPHIFKILPRYDIVPRREITPVNVPELVSTNHYLKVKVPRRSCRSEYVPLDSVPVVEEQYYVEQWPFKRNVSHYRQLPLVKDSPRMYTTCRMFRGELEQLDCDL